MPDGSHVHHEPIDRLGAQLYPGGIATPTPQSFNVASSPAKPTGYGVDRLLSDRPRAATPGHICQV